jgi:hypothetical protein
MDPVMTSQPALPVELIVVLYSDRAEPATAAVLDRPSPFSAEVVAVTVEELVEQFDVEMQWRGAARIIDPTRTAIVNRVTSLDGAAAAHGLSTRVAQQQLWRWLHGELQRFAYASSLPTPTSVIGCYGSLLDQWTDLPELVGGLRVPVHRRPGTSDPLAGDVFATDPWRIYSLGRRLSASSETSAGHLVYVRPDGQLVHAAQVGDMMMFTNAPPHMTPPQRDYIAAFVHAMAQLSDSRILEHAFFVGNGLPVFYSTYPLPVITGAHPAYAELVVEGLLDDIVRRCQRTAA